MQRVRQKSDEPERQYASMRAAVIATSLLFVVAMSATLVTLQTRSEAAVMDGMLSQARAHARQFNAVRAYVQGFTGIYVPASADVVPNPHLEGIPDVTPVITAKDGREFILQNAPLVAREISEIIERDTDGESVLVRLYGLNPLNPENTPDPFAADALALLGGDEREHYALTRVGARATFNYALAIPPSERCGRCHEHLVGVTDGIAGVSVVHMDVTQPLAYLEVSRQYTGLAIVLLVLVSAIGVYLFVTRFLKNMYIAQRQVFDTARKDSLTGLATRRVGVDTLSEEVGRAAREGRCVACCIIDLDDFKGVNDTRGHAVGDLVLSRVGEALSASLRPYDTAARVGGEEFLLVLPGACTAEAHEIVTRTRMAVAAASAAIVELDRLITCSAGIAVLDPTVPESARELYVRADSALLEAKLSGKDRSVTAGPALPPAPGPGVAPAARTQADL